MDKRLRNVVTDTQQEITTKIERDDDDLIVEIRACSALDDELRSDFHDKIDQLGNEVIAISSITDYSNQGNETGQDVTLRFGLEDQLQALDKINEIIGIGREYYERQLERNLSQEDDVNQDWRHSNQQRYFDDDAVKEFCLLFRGSVDV